MRKILIVSSSLIAFSLIACSGPNSKSTETSAELLALMGACLPLIKCLSTQWLRLWIGEWPKT